jgi:hypothetical protein
LAGSENIIVIFNNLVYVLIVDLSMPIVKDDVATKALAKRRVFVFFFVFAIIALLSTVAEESDIFLHALDDYVIIIIAIIALLFIYLSRKKQTVSQLARQHNVILALLVIALIVQIYAIIVEFNDPADFGNEIPVLVLIVMMLVNRFV